jgi:phosphate transport system protein
MSIQLLKLIDDLKLRMSRMTTRVLTVVETATQAVVHNDIQLARKAMEADRLVDNEELDIERRAIDLLALHHPAAADLRFITRVIKVNGDFERIGDCAVNVAQRVPSIARQAALGDGRDRREPIPEDLRRMSALVMSNLRDTVNAFNLADVSLAERILSADDEIDAYYHQIVQDMLQMFEDKPHDAGRELALVMVAKNYERIGDHCTNVAEDIIYMSRGEVVRHGKIVGRGSAMAG